MRFCIHHQCPWEGGEKISAAGGMRGDGAGLEAPVTSRMQSKLGNRKDGIREKREKGDVALSLRDRDKVTGA
jgi:hypothetical protein